MCWSVLPERHHDGQDDPVKKSRNVKRVLITGMSGAGKSSLLHEFAARGYRTADTDYGDYFQTIDGESLWREDRISALRPALPMSSRACCSSRARPATRFSSTPASTTSCCFSRTKPPEQSSAARQALKRGA